MVTNAVKITNSVLFLILFVLLSLMILFLLFYLVILILDKCYFSNKTKPKIEINHLSLNTDKFIRVLALKALKDNAIIDGNNDEKVILYTKMENGTVFIDSITENNFTFEIKTTNKFLVFSIPENKLIFSRLIGDNFITLKAGDYIVVHYKINN